MGENQIYRDLGDSKSEPLAWRLRKIETRTGILRGTENQRGRLRTIGTGGGDSEIQSLGCDSEIFRIGGETQRYKD